MPNGRPYRDSRWRYVASRGDPYLAVDGKQSTAWEVSRPLMGDEVFEIHFGSPTAINGIIMHLRRGSQFPKRFRIVGQDADGKRIRLARYDGRHTLQIIDQLLMDPGSAALGFDFGGVELSSLSVRIGEGGTKWDRLPFPGWSIPEIEVWVP